MTLRTNIVLAVAFAAQIGIAIVESRAGGSAPKRSTTPILEGLVADDLERLEIESGATPREKVTLTRRSDGGKGPAIWRVEQAGDYAADVTKVDSTVRELLTLQAADVVSATDQHYVDLKVGADAFERHVTLTGKSAGGDKKLELFIGTSSRGNAVNVRRGDQATVVTVRDYSPWRLPTTADGWIDRAYFAFTRSRAVAVDLENQGGHLRLERQGRDWSVTPAMGTKRPVAADAAERLVMDLADLHVDQVAALTPEAELGTPAAKVTVELGDAGDAGAAGASPSNDTVSLTLYGKPGAAPVAEDKPKKGPKAPKAAPPAPDHYILRRAGATHQAEAGKWSLKAVLETTAESLPAPEVDKGADKPGDDKGGAPGPAPASDKQP